MPEGWAEAMAEDGQTYYYDANDNTMWEHPNDEIFASSRATLLRQSILS